MSSTSSPAGRVLTNPRSDKILVKVEYLLEFFTTICVDRDATVKDVISIVCTKKNMDVDSHILTLKDVIDNKTLPLDNTTKILPFHKNHLLLVPTNKKEDDTNSSDTGTSPINKNRDKRMSIYREGFMRRMRKYNKPRLPTGDESILTLSGHNNNSVNCLEVKDEDDQHSNFWSVRVPHTRRDTEVSRSKSSRDKSVFVNYFHPLVPHSSHYTKFSGVIPPGKTSDDNSAIFTSRDGMTHYSPSVTDSETHAFQTFRFNRPSTRTSSYRGLGIATSNFSLMGNNDRYDCVSTPLWRANGSVMPSSSHSACTMYLKSAIKYSHLPNLNAQSSEPTCYPYSRRAISWKRSTHEHKPGHLKCCTEPPKDCNASLYTFSDCSATLRKSNSIKSIVSCHHLNSQSTTNSFHKDICDVDPIMVSPGIYRTSPNTPLNNKDTSTTKLIRGISTPIEDVNVYIYIPLINESFTKCMSRSSSAEKLLRVICYENSLDLEEYTLEHQDGSCVELDVSLNKYYEIFDSKNLYFNMVQKGKIYRSMTFYKNNSRILTTISKRGNLQVTSAIPQLLINIFVNTSSSSKYPDMVYIRTLILTYRSYMSPEEFFDALMSTIPELIDLMDSESQKSEADIDNIPVNNPAIDIKGRISGFEAMSTAALSSHKLSTLITPSSCDSSSCEIKTPQTEVDESEANQSNPNSQLNDNIDLSTDVVDALSLTSDNTKFGSSMCLTRKPCKGCIPNMFDGGYNLNVITDHSFRITKEIVPDCETRMRNVITLIKIWLDIYHFDFCLYPPLRDKLWKTLTYLKSFMDGTFNNEAENIMILLKDRTDIYNDLIKSYKLVTGKGKSMFGMIKSIKAEDIASQLCLYDYQIARSIHPIEYLNRLWKKSDTSLSPLMSYFIDRFDVESYWAATEILCASSLKERSSVLKKLIIIAARCLENNNFFSTFAIATGLNSPPISRLKKTWESLSDKVKTIWNRLSYVLDTSKNMKNYRDIMSRAVPPILPFLPICFKDLVFSDDGNPTIVDDKLVNFEKFTMIANINLVKNLPVIKDPDILMKMSMECEHRIQPPLG